MAVFMLTRYRAVKRTHLHNAEMLHKLSELSTSNFCGGTNCSECRFRTYTKNGQERCILCVLSVMADEELYNDRSTVELNGEIYDLEEIK